MGGRNESSYGWVWTVLAVIVGITVVWHVAPVILAIAFGGLVLLMGLAVVGAIFGG